MEKYDITFIELQPGTKDTMPDIAVAMSATGSDIANSKFDKKHFSKDEITSSNGAFSELCGLKSANALWNRAACYDLGYETNEDMIEAKRYYRMALVKKKLDEGRISLSQLPYVQQLLPGWYQFMLSDTVEAYKEAAEKDYPYANFFMGMCYLNGLSVPENNSIANEYFEKSRKLGCTEGTRALANSYLRGYGVTKDENKAILLFKEAYDNGNPGGGLNYAATIWNQGRRDEAMKVFNKLASEGYQPAIDALKQISGH